MTESVKLNNINVFESEDQYNENKGTVSANDLNLIPINTIPISDGGTGATTASEALTNLGITSGTEDLVAGTSELTTGAIYLVYE